jgi:hypothetical protein
MTDITPKSTIDRLLDELETLAAWREDLDSRVRRASICLNSSVGLSHETQDSLLHEGSALKRAMNHVRKRISSK